MKFKISKDRRTLTIFTQGSERRELKRLGDEIQQDKTMLEFLEPLVCNSELQWVTEQTSGDLTSAPMLGILGDEMTALKINQAVPRHYGMIQCGFWNGKAQFQPILERWAYMPYGLRSPIVDLRDKGKAIFQIRIWNCWKRERLLNEQFDSPIQRLANTIASCSRMEHLPSMAGLRSGIRENAQTPWIPKKFQAFKSLVKQMIREGDFE